MGQTIPLLLCALVSAPAVFAATTGYHLLSDIKVGGEGGWD